jgi:hypothetical protein
MRRAVSAPGNLVLFVLAVVYCLQVVTPLRLQFDSIILLSSAENAARGGGFLFHGQPTVFPPGYPALVALLMRLHIAYNWVMVGLNILFLFAGLWALGQFLYPIYLEKRSSLSLLCILTLLSAVVVQLFTIPVTDFLFFASAMCSLAVMSAASSQLTARRIIASITLVVISICIRRVGLALIPSFLWMVLARADARLLLKQTFAKTKAVSIPLAACVAAAIPWVVYRTSTLSDLFVQTRLHGSAVLLRMPSWRIRELGEIAINLPTVFPDGILTVAGILFALLVFAGLFTRRKQFGVVDIYFVAYVAGILFWPFYAIRFWLPVLPLLIVYLGISLERFARREAGRYVVASYAAVFATAGIVQLWATTTVSFSGPRIGDVYRTNTYDRVYCAAGFCKQKVDPDQVVDRNLAARSGMSSWYEEDGLRLLCEFRDGKLATGNR